MSPVTVLYIITDLDFGGTERQLSYLVENLDQNRYEPVVLSLKTQGRAAKELADKNFSIYSVSSPMNPFVIWQKLREIRDKHRPKIIHTFLFRANIVGRIFGRFGFKKENRPVVISSVRVWDNRWLALRLEKWTKNWADFFIFNSAIVQQKYGLAIGIKNDDKNCRTILNAIDPEPYKRACANRKETRASLGFYDSHRVIISIGRLDEQKGFLYLIEAFKTVYENNKSVRLIIVGDGPMREKLNQGIDRFFPSPSPLPFSQSFKDAGPPEAGRSPQRGGGWGEGDKAVRLLGYRNDIPELLAASDCLVLASLWEGSPNVILEAWATGTVPVVATGVGGTPDIIKDEQSGLLVPPKNPEALANAIKKIFRENLGPHLAAQGGQKLSHHLPPAMAASVQAIYDKLFQARIAYPS
ncbi:MAG: glycosyltransferase [Elusimicrobia bacterium]|nr:glycosyltransferase [Elusimicrobiota bacterium]